MSTIGSITPKLAHRFLRRPHEAVGEQRWVRRALCALLLLTAAAYLANLGASARPHARLAAVAAVWFLNPFLPPAR